ncbi:serine hydrolase [Actinoplanes sp. NPDC051513]|uniref:serine hydrolase n=1 Tax=Actinoplanes sp. NPDC051513 TaxID=3363908 RepID=UPI00378EE1AB
MTLLPDRQERIDRAAERHGVPGAGVAVGAGGELAEAATGVVNRNSGVEATPDAVFQIGSVTKVWTASLVMQLVDEGWSAWTSRFAATCRRLVRLGRRSPSSGTAATSTTPGRCRARSHEPCILIGSAYQGASRPRQAPSAPGFLTIVRIHARRPIAPGSQRARVTMERP